MLCPKKLAVAGTTKENVGPPEQGSTSYCFGLLLATSGAVVLARGESDPVTFSKERKPVIYRFFGAFSDALNLTFCIAFQHQREFILHGLKAFGVSEVGAEPVECETAAITCTVQDVFDVCCGVVSHRFTLINQPA